MQEPDSIEFGQRVKRLREMRDMTQKALGVAAGFSQQRIVTIEAGGTKKPSKLALSLAAALRTSSDWLLYEKGPRDVGPIVRTRAEFVRIYDQLPPEAQAALSSLADQYLEQAKQKRA